MLLEQAALCYLRTDPIMKRKYGFHMVLAGNRYNLSGQVQSPFPPQVTEKGVDFFLLNWQRRHALRAYKFGSGIYEGLGWLFISDHCDFTLGRSVLGGFKGCFGGLGFKKFRGVFGGFLRVFEGF